LSQIRKAKLCHQSKKTIIRTLKRTNQHFLLVNFSLVAIEETKCNFCKVANFLKWLIVIKMVEGSVFSNHQI
jgi:hypothetical protein